MFTEVLGRSPERIFVREVGDRVLVYNLETLTPADERPVGLGWAEFRLIAVGTGVLPSPGTGPPGQ